MKRDNIELLLAWLDAWRRRDLDNLAAALHPAVVWQGLREDLVCQGREAVVRGFVAQRDQGYDVDALELIGAGRHAVLGVHRPDLTDIEGIALHGPIYIVFTITDNTITRIEDHAERHNALAAAGLPRPPAAATAASPRPATASACR